MKSYVPASMLYVVVFMSQNVKNKGFKPLIISAAYTKHTLLHQAQYPVSPGTVESVSRQADSDKG